MLQIQRAPDKPTVGPGAIGAASSRRDRRQEARQSRPSVLNATLGRFGVEFGCLMLGVVIDDRC